MSSPPLHSRLRRNYAAAAQERWLEIELDLDRLETRQARYASARGELGELSDFHRRAQREVWELLRGCDACQRAEILAAELAGAPELPGLPKPDLSAFEAARRDVETAIPAAYREGADAICFNPEQARQAVDRVVALAPASEAAASSYFYDAVRGYEEALGPERTKQIMGLLKDPEAVRKLREQHPGLFQQQEQLAAPGMGSMLPMLLAFSLLSAHSPGWAPPPARAAGLGSDAPPEPAMDDWLGRYGAPSSADLASIDITAGELDGGEASDLGGELGDGGWD